MRTPRGELFSSGPIERDGVIYEVLVIRSEDGYHGGWVCVHCNEQCTIETPSATREQAADRARAGVDAHYIMVHATA
jgi:hypothetical protein